MLKASAAVIESGRRNTPVILCLVVVFVLAATVFMIYRGQQADTQYIYLNNVRFKAEIADTPMARERGLSGRSNLSETQAMLFTYEQSANNCFWMRDMRFAIDMVWLDDQQAVSAIERDVRPTTYPQNFCHVSRSVIEFKAGTVDRINLKIGDQVKL